MKLPRAEINFPKTRRFQQETGKDELIPSRTQNFLLAMTVGGWSGKSRLTLPSL